MRRTCFILLLIGLSFRLSAAHTYVESSVFGSGNFVKLQISSTGIYMLTYDQIQSMGLNPKNIRVLGYGGNLIAQDFSKARIDDVPSIPFYMHKGLDDVFNSGDYILFYANGPVGWEWYSTGKYYKHTRNCYADYGCYFLSDNAGEQRLLATQESALEDGDAEDVYSYTALQLHELDQRNLVDLNGESGGGREWYGESIDAGGKLSISFNFTNAVKGGRMVCRVDAAAAATTTTSLNVSVSGQTSACSFVSTSSLQHAQATTGSCLIASDCVTGNSLPVSLSYTSSINSAKVYLNYIEMQVSCNLQLKDNLLFIRNTEYIGSPTPSRYHLVGADAYTQIWNLTQPDSAYVVQTTWEGDTLCWLGSNTEPQLFAAIQVNSSNWPSPASRGRVANQNLHKQLRGVQHVIVTPDEFRAPAQRLKLAHEQLQPSEHWAVVSAEEVYNEFSSGTPDASAIRWMMKYIYDTAPNKDAQPKTLLLMGDGSFDNRQLLKTSPQPTLITYQAINSTQETEAYATDDYFGWVNDKDGVIGSTWKDAAATLSVAVGRLPVNTYDEAEAVVNKLIVYLNNSTAGKWKQQLCFLGDDGDHGLHVQTVDLAAQTIASLAPSYVINKIYLDAYEQETSASGESYPLAYNTFCNLLQTGVLFMDYAGHGSANNICSEMFLTRKQVENMSNANQGLWALATCNFSHFDQTSTSTAEVAVLNPMGGAIGVISADRTVFATPNTTINNLLCQNLFYHTDPFTYPYTIGEALRRAKNSCGTTSSTNINKLPYLLLGDPAVKLNHPCQYEAIISEIPDILHALDLVTIKGYISTGDTLSSERRDTVNFDGELSVCIYDKEQVLTTRDNDEPDESKRISYSFTDYPSILFSGNVEVQNGLFSLTFRMPKDIRYNTGAGRITLYAQGEVDDLPVEAMGHSEQFLVGGSSPIVIHDEQGPEMQLYLNTPLFNNGDQVNSTPHFYANLYDENGINTVGSGIGHDLQLIIDNSKKQTYILNSYYTAESNSYQRGTVSYILPTLASGNHSLSFRAWDMPGNATTKTLNFTVDNEMGPNVKQLVVYPNPVSQFGTLNMYLQHDRPDELLSIEIAFYTTLGQKVWSTYRSIYDTTLSFDMTEASLPAGTYIYQFTIQTSSQSSEKHNGRIIVY